mmetsp:Transcript_145829/g.279604  ORF Transcript_145829/g.279604 Transcript_145829/m.279604 type:complete len:115 (-) Transcript_145829:18-362(-)
MRLLTLVLLCLVCASPARRVQTSSFQEQVEDADDQNDLQISLTVRSIIADRLEIDVKKVKLDASLFDDLGADSLDVLELIMAMELAFNIEISEYEAEQLTTPADWVAAIKAKLS